MNKFLFLGILFFTVNGWAASDRFGNERREIPRSSFTKTADVNVFIATITHAPTTAPTYGGSLIVRSVIFSGIIPSTITFYDDSEFDGTSSTKTELNYIPIVNPFSGGAVHGAPVEVNVDLHFSSGIGYHKVGLAPVQIKWDWLTPRKSGDSRN